MNKAAIPLQTRTATLQCLDRSIELKADCGNAAGDGPVACARQSLAVADSARPLNLRTFTAVPENKVGELACVATKSKEKYIVARHHKAAAQHCIKLVG